MSLNGVVPNRPARTFQGVSYSLCLFCRVRACVRLGCLPPMLELSQLVTDRLTCLVFCLWFFVVSVSLCVRACVRPPSCPPPKTVFEVADLSMKFERHLDCDAIDFMPLAEGYEKLAFLLADRTLAFHAGYGKHHSVRIPRFGRSLAYQRETCECAVYLSLVCACTCMHVGVHACVCVCGRVCAARVHRQLLLLRPHHPPVGFILFCLLCLPPMSTV